jgi:ATP adenylyltransferase
MLLGLSESLPVLVGKRFTAAKDSGGLVFSNTQLTTIHASRVPVRTRRGVRPSIGREH